jgi:RHS repeat-associated protein
MDSIATGPGGSTTVQNLAYLWDDAGNLMQRQDNNQGLTENFYYDNLHRLDSSTLGGSTNLDVTLDDKGNVTSKSGVGTYTYHATKIHAVSSINTGGGTLSYSYDAAGNMTNRNGTTLTWYANNLPKAITKDANNSSIFEYGPGRGRWKHLYKTGGTTYTHTYIGKLMEKVVTGSTTEYKHFISVKGASLALISRKSTGVNASYYRHDDHLGSTEHLTNSSGSNVVMESFGAYGQRRGTNWTGSPTSGELATINATTRKGFTEHEMLDSTELVHMNGRVFDPVIGRFVSADPIEDCGLKTQGWNRYAYVGNRPLSLIDPTGHLCITYMPGENGWRVGCDGWAFFDDTFIPIPPFGITNSEAGGGSTSQCRDAQSRCQQFGGAECEAAQIICNDTWAPPVEAQQNTSPSAAWGASLNGSSVVFVPDDPTAVPMSDGCTCDCINTAVGSEGPAGPKVCDYACDGTKCGSVKLKRIEATSKGINGGLNCEGVVDIGYPPAFRQETRWFKISTTNWFDQFFRPLIIEAIRRECPVCK